MPICSLDSGDPLSQILNSIGISGSLLLKEQYCSPWAVAIPDSNQLNTLLNTTSYTHIATFHLVERGHIYIKPDNGDELLIEASEMVVCFSGQGHTLYQGASPIVTSFQDIFTGKENRFKPDESTSQKSTSLVCGVFLMHNTLLNPLLATLPHILKLSVTDADDFPRLSGIIKLLIQEFNYQSVGNSYVIERYLEILCVETIRAHVDSLPEQATGWLSALKDPVIGHLIELIHAKPGHPWTVKILANEVAMSPSRLAARFVAIVGESPMAYVSKWRMFVASQELKIKHNNIAQIANNVGYESLASFSRAFKRHLGLSPAAWRSLIRDRPR